MQHGCHLLPPDTACVRLAAPPPQAPPELAVQSEQQHAAALLEHHRWRAGTHTCTSSSGNTPLEARPQHANSPGASTSSRAFMIASAYSSLIFAADNSPGRCGFKTQMPGEAAVSKEVGVRKDFQAFVSESMRKVAKLPLLASGPPAPPPRHSA